MTNSGPRIAAARQAPPPPGPPRRHALPAVERRDAGGGFPVFVVRASRVPLVTARLVFDASPIDDPPGRDGLAQVVARTLERAPVPPGDTPLVDRLEACGAMFSAGADWDATALSVTSLSEHAGEALAALANTVAAPRTDPEAFASATAEQLSSITAHVSAPGGMADVEFLRAAYAPEARYARIDAGDVASLRAMRIEEAERFASDRVARGPSALIVVGDVDDRWLEPAVARLAGIGATARSAERSRSVIADQASSQSRVIRVVDVPHATNCELRLGHVGLERRHPDYFAVTVMNAILGGVFTSRINQNLRERNGFAYHAQSSWGWRRHAGPFTISTAVRTDAAGRAVRETLDEIDRIRNERVTAAELARAVSHIADALPLRLETTASIAQAVSAIAIHGLPTDYYERFGDNVRAVDASRVMDAAQAHVRPDDLRIVAVGNAEAVAPLLSDLGIPVEIKRSQAGR